MKQKNLSFLGDISVEEKNFFSRVIEWSIMAEEKFITKYSGFLDERMIVLCRKVFSSLKYDNYAFWGGYENAERKMLCVYPPYDEVDLNKFPLKAIKFSFREQDKLSHRDFLGALMSLQISRDSIGDILVGDGIAYVFVRESVADCIFPINKIGKIGVKICEGFDEDFIPKCEYREIHGTVASMRSDCIFSLALGVSREKAVNILKSGNAYVDHSLCSQPSKLMEEGSKFSARGYGKYLLKKVDGISRKDRIHITVYKYI